MNISKLSWLSVGLSVAVLGLTACSSSEESKAPDQVATKTEASQAAAAPQDAAAQTQTTQDAKATDAAAQDPNAAGAEGGADATAPTAAVNPDDVFSGRKVYLRGEMNDYGVQEAYELKPLEANKYCTVAPLRSDWSPYRFKFADENWTAGTNFGYAIPPAVIREGSARAQLNPNSRFEELRYEPQEDGIYRFCIEFENNVPYATVTFMEKSRLTSLVTMDDLMEDGMERLVAKRNALDIAAQAQAAMLAHSGEVVPNEVQATAANSPVLPAGIQGSPSMLNNQHAANASVDTNSVM